MTHPSDDNVLHVRKDHLSDKKYLVAVILAGIFGVLGIHHFYVGRYGMGLFDLSLSVAFITLFAYNEILWGVLFLMVDLAHTVFVTYKLLVGEYRDGEGRIIVYPGQQL